ncbi:hypothetical protein D2V93_10630 [Flagellimonas taeanensis]|jgi:hypothetical protein|nr:hypothetical protein D2V93_10630 [Allomuricauda taeanensis]
MLKKIQHKHVSDDGQGKTEKEKNLGQSRILFLTQFFCREIGAIIKSKQLIINKYVWVNR